MEFVLTMSSDVVVFCVAVVFGFNSENVATTTSAPAYGQCPNSVSD